MTQQGNTGGWHDYNQLKKNLKYEGELIFLHLHKNLMKLHSLEAVKIKILQLGS